MPTRILRDGIIESKAVNSLSLEAEVFYRRLMSVVDDYGRFEADPELLRSRCFGRQLERWAEDLIGKVLAETQRTFTEDGDPLVLVYACKSRTYLQVMNFKQRVRGASKFPEPTVRQLTDARRGSPPPADNSGKPPSLAGNSAKPADAETGFAGSLPKAEAEAKTDAKTDAKAKPQPQAVVAAAEPGIHPISEAEFPELTEVIQGRFPSADGAFILRIAQDSIQRALSKGIDPSLVNDRSLTAAAVESLRTDRAQSAGLLLRTIPQIIETWGKTA